MMVRLVSVSSLLFGWAVGTFLFTLLPATAQAQQPLRECFYSAEIPLDADGTVLMQQYVDYQEGTYSVRLRYTEGYSWMGIGINYNGDAYMVPAYTVIGRMVQETASSVGVPSVGRYWLERTVVDGVLPIEDPNGHLKVDTASFVQQDGDTVLEFTHDLIIMEEGVVYENVTSGSTWIWAVGPEGNDWGSRHRLQGSFSLTLADTCVETPFLDDANDTLVVEFSPPGGDNETVWSNDAIVGGGDSSITYNESQTRVSRGLWITHGLFMGLAWGLCAPLAIGASLFRTVGFLKKNDLWLKLHMYLNAAVAFLTMIGFFIAVRAMNKEGGQGHFKDETHHKVGLTVFLFVLAQCVLGYLRPSKEQSDNKEVEEEEEQSVQSVVKVDEHHSEAESTVIEVEVSEKADITEVASASGEQGDEEGFEMDMTNIAPLTEDNEENQGKEDSSQTDGDSGSRSDAPVAPATSMPSESRDDQGSEAFSEDQEVSISPSAQSVEEHKENSDRNDGARRNIWLVVHRVLGVILLSLAWYNCHSGIVLFSEKYDTSNERQLLNVFWGFAATVAVLFLLQGFVLRK